MKGSISMVVEMGLRLDEVLLESELNILEALGEQSVNLAQQQWTGWKYKGNYPKEWQGTSLRGWKFQALQPTGRGGFVRGITILNDATKRARPGVRKDGEPYSSSGVGKHYARFVHRAGKSVQANSDQNREWLVVRNRISKELIPAAIRVLKDEIISNAGKNRVRKELSADKAGIGTEMFDILSQSTF